MVMSDSSSEQGRWGGWVLVLIVVVACFLILYFFQRPQPSPPLFVELAPRTSRSIGPAETLSFIPRDEAERSAMHTLESSAMAPKWVVR